MDTLDLRDAGDVELTELKNLASRVLEHTRNAGPSGFSDPTMHPTYVAKVEELATAVRRAHGTGTGQ